MSTGKPAREFGTRDLPLVRLLPLLVGPGLVCVFGALTATQERGNWLLTAVMVTGLGCMAAGLMLRVFWHEISFSTTIPEGRLPRRTRRIADVEPETWVAVTGRVVRAAQVIQSPVSERSGFCVRLEFNTHEPATRWSKARWRLWEVELLGAGFVINDGSGVEAAAAAGVYFGADVERGTKTWVHESDAGVEGFPKAIREYIRGHRKLHKSLRKHKGIRIYETVAEIGDTVTIVSRFEPERREGYRDQVDTRLLVPSRRRGKPGEGYDCFLGTLRELRAQALHAYRRRLFLTLLGIGGAVLFAAGVAASHHSR